MNPPIANPGKVAVRKAIQAKRSPEISLVVQYGKMFLEKNVSQKNNISFEEFAQFIPLYVKSQFEKLPDDERRRLSYMHAQRFNIQEPIRILDLAEPDENGAVYPTDGNKYKIIATLPARTRRLESINKLGGNTPQLAAELLANARNSNNPFDTQGQYYSEQLARLLAMANQDSIKAQDESFRKYAKEIVGKKPQPQAEQKETPEQPEENYNPTGIGDADWEE